MKPADLDRVRAALEGQAALLGQHQSQFEAVHRSLEAITTNISNMATQLQRLTPEVRPSHTAWLSRQSAPPDAQEDCVR